MENIPSQFLYLENRIKDLNKDLLETFKIWAKELNTTSKKESVPNPIIMQENKLLDMAALGTWNWVVQKNTVTISETAKELLGVEESDMPFETFCAFIHEDDLTSFKEALQEYIQSELSFEIEIRILLEDTYKWIAFHGKSIKEKDHLLGITALVQDIHDKKIIELKNYELTAAIDAAQEEIDIQNLEISRLQQKLQEVSHQLGRANRKESAFNEEERNGALHQNLVQEIENKNYEMNALIYKISHDIRAPLSSVIGLLNLAKIEEKEEELKKYLEYAEKQSLKLDNFIKSLLDFIKSNTKTIKIETIDFEDLIKDCFEDIKFKIDFNSIRKTVKVKGKQTKFYSDYFKLHVIFSNIISNAVKFQNPYCKQKEIQINVEVNEDTAQITFEDNGIGMQQKHLDQIFKMFFRGNDRNSGSGLGLYIVNQLVDKLKGRIEIKSEEGKYTRFLIEIPNEKNYLKPHSILQNEASTSL